MSANISFVFSQIRERAFPPSLQQQSTMTSATFVTNVPINFYIEDLREIDAWEARDGAPLRISKLVPVNYSMENAGFHTLLPNGENIWRLHLKARDAVAIMLYYNDFYIPEGGRLFIYNPDYSLILGAFTHWTHPSGGLFATEFIGGDELILEYVASVTTDEPPRISIKDVGYGYNTAALREFCGISTRAISGSCEVNINCEEGDAWQNEKRSVCYTVQRVGSEAYICTGALMNNTAQDFKPLILTALHCSYNNKYTIQASEADMKQWLFYFNRELEGCSNSSLPNSPPPLTGCKLLAATGLTGGSDGLLLLLNNPIPDSYNVYFNGWDCSDQIATSGVCIHHPSGDYKKISTYDEPAKTYSYHDNNITCDNSAHLNVIFRATPNGHGVTEGGSSGSPLFNEYKLVVGTLTGGNSSCTTSGLRGYNIYGKINYHWDRYKKDSTTRMDVWLDPLNTGIKVLSGRFLIELLPPPTNLKAVNLGTSIALTWNEPQSNDKPKNYNVYRNNSKIANVNALLFIDNETIVGSTTYSVSAVYDNGDESSFATTNISIIKYKAPSNVKAERQENSNQIKLSWNAPVYEQTIFWGTLDPYRMVGFDVKTPFYFGQKWTSEDINSLNNNVIRAIQFYPINNNTYEIFITQGEHQYRQPINTLTANKLNDITLTTPFVIDGSKSLIVSIFISVVGSNLVNQFPATTDNGPLVVGKGNLCSFDGSDWFLFNENAEPGSFEYNFILAAVVSSESGEVTVRNADDITSNRKIDLITCPPDVSPRMASLNNIDNPVNSRSSRPAAFPEVTNYNIYQSGSFIKKIVAPETSYSYNASLPNHYYEVTAVYDQIESERSSKTFIHVTDNEFIDPPIQLFPTKFSNFISLQGSELVARLEIISPSGAVCHAVTHPGQIIDTSTLTPGLYFIRIYDIHKRQKVIKAIKEK